MKQAYETMFLLSPTTNEEEYEAFLAKSKESVEKKHGEVTNVRKMGVRKTAYEVKKSNTALYILLTYKGTGDTVKELEKMFKNSEEVWKFLTTKVADKPIIGPTRKVRIAKVAKAKEAKMAVEATAATPAPAVPAATESAPAPAAVETKE